MARNTENRKKGEMHTVGPGIWMGKLKKKGKWYTNTV